MAPALERIASAPFSSFPVVDAAGQFEGLISEARQRRSLAALTNSTAQVAEAQLTNAGLAGYFEQSLSADMVRRLKPAPEPYLMAAERMGVKPSAVRLIAAHAWDVAGALRAGCAAAFVARPGMVLDPLVEMPDVIGADLRAVADQILAIELSQGEAV